MITEKCCKHPAHLQMCNIDDFPVINGIRSSWCSSCRREHADSLPKDRNYTKRAFTKLDSIKKRCPSGDMPANRHFITSSFKNENGICPTCGISYDIILRNGRARHKNGIDLVATNNELMVSE